MHILHNILKNYNWGSRTLLAEWMHSTPSGAPEAEVWMGTHPGAPSTVQQGASLTSLTALRSSHGRANGELPFLLKLLAAGQPLSLQAHPNEAQAREGYARENAAGIALSDAARSYKDPYAKPELIVALGAFEALSGFRTMSDIAQTLGRTGVPYIDTSVTYAVSLGDGEGQRVLFQTWMSARGNDLEAALRAFVLVAKRVLSAPTYAWWSRTQLTFPSDATVLIALLLEHLVLRPGEGIFLPAGNLHAYLGGLGIEIMGPSDNVLRGGMTPKHVNVTELGRVLRFEPYCPAILRAAHSDAGPHAWPTAEAPFCLATESVQTARAWIPNTEDEIVLCVEGSPLFDNNLLLRTGDALYVAKESPPRQVSGTGRWVRASSNLAPWATKRVS